MKSIELTQSQIKALQSGATMFIFPISDYDLNRINKGYSIGDSIPINKCDKDIFVQKKFIICEHENYNDHVSKGTYICYDTKSTNHFSMEYFQASQMTKEQSKYSFNECIDVRIVKVQDWIKYLDTKNKKAIESFTFHVSNEPISQKRRRAFESFYNQQMKEQNINRTYEDNDYVFLVEFA